MKRVQIEFSKYESVNFLWPELIEDYGFDKAKKIVSQAIDLQKMNGTKNSTMPIIFSGTGGSALIQTQMLKKENFDISYKDNQVLIFNLKRKSFQILNEAN
jgi:hypothetical protein